MTTDFDVINGGSIFNLVARTPAALAWCDDNLPDDFMGAVEHRYIEDILSGIEMDGLTYS